MPQVIGDLLIITPQFVGCLLAVALLSLLVALWLARRRRRMLAIGAGLLALLLLPVTAADAVNAHYQYLPRVADVVNTPTWPTARAAVAVEQLVANTALRFVTLSDWLRPTPARTSSPTRPRELEVADAR